MCSTSFRRTSRSVTSFSVTARVAPTSPYGQLKPMLWWDPHQQHLPLNARPRRELDERVDDLSWLPVVDDDGWSTLDDLEETVGRLLTEAGQTYVPFMLANDEALRSGADEVVCEIRGDNYRQGPFKYQGKCLSWIRESYSALSADDRGRVDSVLHGTGCEPLVAQSK